MYQRLLTWAIDRRHGAAHDDRGSSVIETVIIAGGLAALALSTMAAFKLLVDGKVAGISL